jgi:tRNA/tmRNA/rRNA uracil-C5-methylase (TrmA/RlmC/RlmD family)
VVHVSCDPATLARDLAVLTQRGFALERVTGLDLFPQTPHVEAVAVLVRARPPRGS